jgi:sugar-specific transcriptional regulator TrmB
MKEQLEQYGLTSKEADIYLACLKEGETTAGRLSKITEIRRSTTYEIIDSLKRKGLLSSIIKNKKSYFIAAKPKTLIDLLREKENIISEIIPSLNRIAESQNTLSKASIFKGVKSIKPVVLDILNHKEVFIYGAGNVGEDYFGSFIENFARKRLEKKVVAKAIMGTNVPQHMLSPEVLSVTNIRKLALFNDFKTVYFLYGDNFLSISLSEDPLAVKINDKTFTDSQKEIFQFLWSIAKS